MGPADEESATVAPALPTVSRISQRLFEDAAGLDMLETHISRVVFVDELVYKRKKAVQFAFIDLRSFEQRAALCAREVELNRRFGPDVYVGVADVVDDAGRIVDRAVVMRRMPAERRLSTLLEQHVDVGGCLDSIARILAGSHSDADRGASIASVATQEGLAELWERTLDELEAFTDPAPSGAGLEHDTLQSVRRLATEYIDGRAALFAERIEHGQIVDGHGDLLADDIFCLSDGPRILDCLEFDDRLRWGDVLNDVCFLAMDLERLGRADLAADFVDSYRRYSAETHPPSLEHHYTAYRALVRAKVSCLKAGAERVLAATYLEQCQRHLLDARVRLVVIGGLPGTGKSTLAEGLGDELGFVVLRSDELRKERAGLDLRDRANTPYGTGLYTASATADNYRALTDRARQLLARGESVVLDASFATMEQRAMAARVAAESSAQLLSFCCILAPDVAADRLTLRASAGGDASDADAAIARQAAERFEMWPGAIAVDTVPPIALVLPPVVAEIRAGPGHPA